ncbi:hypothetical protein BDQ17DRAFT_1333970 [Cyathus striatus]|nr:hypothetical protein BDQ17DRAFT_1333970 [Cyathus striatus]
MTLRLLESPTILFKYPVIQLQKCFKIGDGIRVKSGHLKGIVRMVSDIQPYGQIGEEKVTIITFPIKGHHDKVHRSHTFKEESMADHEYEARIMHYDMFPEIFKGLNIVGDSLLSMNICPMPQWENNLGTGSHTPAWNPSSRTLQVKALQYIQISYMNSMIIGSNSLSIVTAPSQLWLAPDLKMGGFPQKGEVNWLQS